MQQKKKKQMKKKEKKNLVCSPLPPSEFHHCHSIHLQHSSWTQPSTHSHTQLLAISTPLHKDSVPQIRSSRRGEAGVDASL